VHLKGRGCEAGLPSSCTPSSAAGVWGTSLSASDVGTGLFAFTLVLPAVHHFVRHLQQASGVTAAPGLQWWCAVEHCFLKVLLAECFAACGFNDTLYLCSCQRCLYFGHPGRAHDPHMRWSDEAVDGLNNRPKSPVEALFQRWWWFQHTCTPP
jgi:hypothetical protein